MGTHDGTSNRSHADIAREYLIENAGKRAETWICERCGSSNAREEDFCTRCGADGSGARAAQAQAQTPSGQPADPPPRSSPEARARILQMFKRGNRKYALPFEGDRLALTSFLGGNWEEYGQIILQMAILDTMLSIEEKLGDLLERDQRPDV